MSDSHFVIQKGLEGDRTVTRINRIDGDASIEELARLLGTAEITDAVLVNAREMKKMANDTKIKAIG